MILNIKVSRFMEGNEAPLGKLERYVIRLPEKVRACNGLSVGDIVSLVEKTGNKRLLTVQPALLKDVYSDEESAYVSKETFDNLRIEREKSVEKSLDLIEGITLGCDPEFFLVKKNQVMYPVGFGGKRGKVGSDGVAVEIRPDPGKTEEEVLDTMHGLVCGAETIKNKMRYGKEIDLMAFSAIGPDKKAGFHLHFGLPTELNKPGFPEVRAFLRHVSYVLDYYVSVPALIKEEVFEAARRTGGHYGKPADIRLNGVTIEYRVPGGHHMRAPFLAKGLIGLGAAVIEDALSKTKVITDDFKKLYKFLDYSKVRELYEGIPSRADVIKALVSPDNKLARNYLDNIAVDLSKMISFDKHPSIKKFIEYCAGDWKVSPRMSHNWRKVDENGQTLEILW